MNPFSYAEYFLSITCLRVKNSGAKKAAHQMVLYQDMWIVGAHTQALRKFRNRCVPRNLYPPDVRSSKEKVSNKLKIGYREAHFSTTYTVGGLFLRLERASLLYAQCCEAVFVFVMAKRQFSYFIINASASQPSRQAGQV